MADDETRKERLETLRQAIIRADSQLIELLGERLTLAREIGRLKKGLGRPVLDPGREAEVVRRAAELARERGVDAELVRDVLWRVIARARELQDASDDTED